MSAILPGASRFGKVEWKQRRSICTEAKRRKAEDRMGPPPSTMPIAQPTARPMGRLLASTWVETT